MKTLALALALSLSATTSMAFGSVTPALNFPKDNTPDETVTQGQTRISH